MPRARHPVRLVSICRPATRRSATKRYVFNWNRDKFPDIDGFVAELSRSTACGCAPTSSRACCRTIPRSMKSPRAGSAGQRRATAIPRGCSSGTKSAPTSTSRIPTTIDWWKARVKDEPARPRHRGDLERQQRVRDLVAARARRTASATPYPAHRGEGAANAADDARVARRAARARARAAAVPRVALGRRRHAALRADLVRRQLHVVGNAALQPADGPGPRDVGRVEQRPRHRRLFAARRRARSCSCAGWRSASSCRASASTRGTTTAPSTSRGCIPKSRRRCAELIRLRYRLMPYLYELLWQSHRALRAGPAADVRRVSRTIRAASPTATT